mgnify:CR=1 FL=1
MTIDVAHLQLPPLADHWVAVDGDELARLLHGHDAKVNLIDLWMGRLFYV